MKRRLALGIAVLGILAALLALGGLDLLRDPDRLAAFYTETGPWGPLVFLLLFTFLEPVGVPGVLFFVPAALVWPPAQAFFLTWLGALGAAAFGFAFARWLARDWVAERLPARFRRIDQRIGERPLVSVILIRLVFFLAPPAHWVLGLSRVRFGPYLLGSAIGYLPGVALVVLASRGLFDLLRAAGSGAWLAAALVLVAGLGVRRYLSRRDERSPPEGDPR